MSALTEWLEASGFRVFHAEVDLGPRGRWQRVLAGAYTDSQTARRDAERLKAAAPQSDAHLVSAGVRDRPGRDAGRASRTTELPPIGNRTVSSILDALRRRSADRRRRRR